MARTHYRVSLVVVATAVLGSSGACTRSLATLDHGDDQAAPPVPTAEIFAAIASGDTASLRARVGDDLRWVSGTSGGVIGKARLLAAAARTSSTVSLSYRVDSLKVWQHGDIAMAEYQLTDRRAFRDYTPTFIARASDVYVRRGSGNEPRRWELTRHTQTWIVRAPDTTSLSVLALRDFVGRYDRGAGYIDDVHLVNGYLVAQSTLEALLGAPGAHLWPVSSSTFSPEGSAPMIVFERDASGRVTGYVQQAPDGPITRARKLDP
ncbi:MAG TPA: nuclear transport factor 2 family protein [Gemmatimonadaceae bacterium]|nr:nuclear transport factor 2 family protein [Gemmatimonadaceae bacterium]